MANRNKTAGSGWELACIKLLQSHFPDKELITTRLGSRELDNSGIDIMNRGLERLEFNFQCKNLSRKADYPDILSSMPEGEDNIILHKFTQKAKTRFVTKGKYAIMDLETLIKLLDVYNQHRETTNSITRGDSKKISRKRSRKTKPKRP
jgi:hypothetical protein